jgi:hypothetical protein
MDIDTTYMQRAQRLVREAKERAYSTKGAVAWANYWTEETKTRLKVTFGSGVVISAASAAAVIGATLGGVALGAATMGIGPAVGIAVAYLGLKLGQELTYSQASKTLKGNLTQSEKDEDHFEIKDPSLLLPAVLKVVKKYHRVERRATQLGGGLSRLVSSIRHAVTSARSFAKKHGYTTGSTRFKQAGPAHDDPELSDRLFELQFYGQILFNYVEKLIEDVAIDKRDRVVNLSQLIYAHVVRQVHITGNHRKCEKCYTMTDREFEQALKAAERVKRRAPAPAANGRPQKAQFAMSVDDAQASNFVNQVHQGMTPIIDGRRLRQNLNQLIPVEVADRERNLTSNVNAFIDEGRVWGARAVTAVAPDLTAAPGTLAAYGAGAAQSAPVSAVGGLVLVELTNTIKNRLTRRSVLKREAHAMELLSDQQEAQDEAMADFRNLIETSNIINRADRGAVKCTSYIGKLDRIQESFATTFEKVAQARGSNRSVYASCDEAYEMVYGVNYFFRNSEKFISFLVYLEAILLQIDREVSRLVPGVSPGDVIRPGVPAPPKPETVQ